MIGLVRVFNIEHVEGVRLNVWEEAVWVAQLHIVDLLEQNFRMRIAQIRSNFSIFDIAIFNYYFVCMLVTEADVGTYFIVIVAGDLEIKQTDSFKFDVLGDLKNKIRIVTIDQLKFAVKVFGDNHEKAFEVILFSDLEIYIY